MTSNYAPGTEFAAGVNVVTYTATDVAGNKATCSFKVIVWDKIPPVFSNYAAKVEVVASESACDATVTWTPPTITDNCGVKSSSASHESGRQYPVGITRVTYDAIDVWGNESSCAFDIVVKSQSPPVITGCPSDIFLRVGESGEAQVTWTEPEASIPCGDVTITRSHEPGSTFGVGTTTVEYLATDPAGLSVSCTFNIVIAYEELAVDVAKVVTPDGNNINDFWELVNIEKFADNTVTVVDRWGGLIYTASGYNNANVAWRGINTNGDLVPTGTYFYTISVRFRNSRIEKKGFIELIR
jgi:gliding motility-associated-like protein